MEVQVQEKSTSSSFWPTTPEEHRQWWAENAPEGIEYGTCWCGCGETTEAAKYTQRLREWLRYCPKKFVHRHATNAKPRVDFGVNRNGGLCHCGCGRPAPIGKTTARSFGLVKGEPVRYINGHHRMLPETYTVEDRGYETPCWIWRNAKHDGYGYIGREGRFHYAHRYFYEREHGPLPDGYQLHHECKVKNCIRLSHLMPLPVVEHQRVHPRTVLTMEKARRIRYLVQVCGMQRKDVAADFGVSTDVVEMVVRGVTWNEDA